MNILQISPSDNLIGGATRVAMDLKAGLEKKGVGTPMFVGKKFSGREDIQPIPKNIIDKGLSYLLANDLDFFRTDFILDTEVFKDADIVHCHNLHGWYFKLDTLRKMSLQKPLIWTLHDMWAVTAHCSHAFQGGERSGFYECPSLDIYPELLWHNEKYLEKRKRGIYEKTKVNLVVPSKWLEEKIKKSVLGSKNIKLIYNGIDTEVFRSYDKSEVRKELGLPENKKIITFIANNGRHSAFKGLNFVVETIRHYQNEKDIMFCCLGAKKEEMGIDHENVIYFDKTADKTLFAKYYSMSDIFLFTSLAENFPLVILEAMACGLPIVSFDVGGVKEALAHKENGYLAGYKDGQDLIKGIDYLLNSDYNKLLKIKEDSSKKVRENFSLETMAGAYLDFYKSLI
jgi:glycosyltransferase involved in cell wall biosynthesis